MIIFGGGADEGENLENLVDDLCMFRHTVCSEIQSHN